MISLNSLSSAEGFLYSGISPSKNLWVNVKVLCKKLPITLRPQRRQAQKRGDDAQDLLEPRPRDAPAPIRLAAGARGLICEERGGRRAEK